jgi:hypothetical protein
MSVTWLRLTPDQSLTTRSNASSIDSRAINALPSVDASPPSWTLSELLDLPLHLVQKRICVVTRNVALEPDLPTWLLS